MSADIASRPNAAEEMHTDSHDIRARDDAT